MSINIDAMVGKVIAVNFAKGEESIKEILYLKLTRS